MNHPDDDFQDRIQRILNEKKREELADKYGAQFSLESDSDLPPEVEAEWLDNIEEFERQFENATRISLREFIGSPSPRALADIPSAELENELNQLLDLMAEHDIFIDFLNEVEDAEAYRFITEELLDEEVDNIRIPGMQCHFIYEEFHPNDEQDAKMWAGEFLHAFFSNDEEQLSVAVTDAELRDAQGAPISLTQLHQRMARFHARHKSISNFASTPLTCEVEGDHATVELALSWESSSQPSAEMAATMGRATLHLKRSQYGGWDVTQAILPGLL